MNVQDYLVDIARHYQLISGGANPEITIKPVKDVDVSGHEIDAWVVHVCATANPNLPCYCRIGHTADDALANLAECLLRETVVRAIRIASKDAALAEQGFELRVTSAKWSDIDLVADEHGIEQARVTVSPMAIWARLSSDVRQRLEAELFWRNKQEMDR